MHQKTAEEIKKERMLDNLLNDDMKEFLPYLEDDSVTDIAVVDSGEIIITQFGKGRTFTGIFVPDFIVERIIKATASLLGRPLESYTGFPILEGRIPKYNARITGLMQPNCIRHELHLRKPPKEIYSLENYVESGRMTQEQYDIIVQTIKDRKNIIVSGSTGSGKTTCTNAIIKKMVECTPDDNFYIVEDTPELQCEARMKTMLQITQDDAEKAVKESLRFSPDRIIFGEVRTGIVMRELLDAWKTGHSGNVTTLHANDGASTLLRIKGMVNKYDPELTDHLSEVISLVVHLKKTPQGIRVNEIFNVNEDSDDFLAGIVQHNLG